MLLYFASNSPPCDTGHSILLWISPLSVCSNRFVRDLFSFQSNILVITYWFVRVDTMLCEYFIIQLFFEALTVGVISVLPLRFLIVHQNYLHDFKGLCFLSNPVNLLPDVDFGTPKFKKRTQRTFQSWILRMFCVFIIVLWCWPGFIGCSCNTHFNVNI